MGVSTLARRAAPASRARMPGSLSSRRWPTAPPWRRAPTTSDVPICTLSSLGSRRVREEFKRPSRQGSQPTSRTGQRTCGRACTIRTRAAAHAPPRRPPRARSRSAPPEQRALRCGLSGRRPAGREEGRARARGMRQLKILYVHVSCKILYVHVSCKACLQHPNEAHGVAQPCPRGFAPVLTGAIWAAAAELLPAVRQLADRYDA